MFDWNTQLAVGSLGEALLVGLEYPNLSPVPSSCREYDALYKERYSVEIKTDTYSLDATPNFFMERYTASRGEQKDGGPWRALADGVDLFVYLFVNPVPVAWWFSDVPRLVEGLDKLVDGQWGHRVYNKGYYSLGFKVARADIVAWCGGSAEERNYMERINV